MTGTAIATVLGAVTVLGALNAATISEKFNSGFTYSWTEVSEGPATTTVSGGRLVFRQTDGTGEASAIAYVLDDYTVDWTKNWNVSFELTVGSATDLGYLHFGAMGMALTDGVPDPADLTDLAGIADGLSLGVEYWGADYLLYQSMGVRVNGVNPYDPETNLLLGASSGTTKKKIKCSMAYKSKNQKMTAKVGNLKRTIIHFADKLDGFFGSNWEPRIVLGAVTEDINGSNLIAVDNIKITGPGIVPR